MSYKAVYFESTSPASPSIQLSHRLLFQGFVERADSPNTVPFDTPSNMTASFGFCDEQATTAHPNSQSMSFTLDPHQSFETLLLSVRLQPVQNGERDVRQEIEVAEGLECVRSRIGLSPKPCADPRITHLPINDRRIWRSWFELPATKEKTQSESLGREAEANEELVRGRQIEHSLDGAATPGLSHRTVSIDKTIAKANVLLHPFSNVASKSAESISRERRQPTHDTIHGAAKQCTLAWRSLDLNVARVVVEHERAEKKKASQIVIYWSGGATETLG